MRTRLHVVIGLVLIGGSAAQQPTSQEASTAEHQASSPAPNPQGPAEKPRGISGQPDAPSQVAKKKTNKIQPVLLSSENWTPLTKYEKFRLFTDDLYSPGTHLSLAGAAWLSWSTNDQSYMGPNFKGWAKRYGYAVADEANGQFFGAFLLPVLFKDDPRYLPRDYGTRKRRAVYAMSRVLVTKKDDGGYHFNYPKVGSAMIVSSLSNLYYPSGRDSSAGATFSRVGFGLASDAGYNIFVEFWPDIARKVRLGKFFQQLVRRTVRVPGSTY